MNKNYKKNQIKVTELTQQNIHKKWIKTSKFIQIKKNKIDKISLIKTKKTKLK